MPRFFMLGSIAVGLVAICAAVGTAIKSVPPVLAWAQTAFAGDTDVRALFEISAPTARPAPPPPAERDAPLAVNGTNGSELLEISASRIEAAGIEVAPVAGAVLRRRLVVPGIITADASRIARVAAKVIGTVAELRKQLGDPVAKGEVVAVLDSREVAEAKAEYLSAQVNFELQKTLFERERSLSQAKIIPENQFLRTRNVFAEAELRLGLARHKLSALNLSEKDIVDVLAQSDGLQRYELRAAIAGRVVERFVDLGAPVGGEGQLKEVYVIADLNSVWIELSVPLGDLPAMREGQSVTVTAGAAGSSPDGKILFVSPMVNQETRTARVVAVLDNGALNWRPGSYVTAQVTIAEQTVRVHVPRTAVQTIKGEPVVFVRISVGFEKRQVELGSSDDTGFEVLAGLQPGEAVAVRNTFVLKAELSKADLGQ